MIPRGEGESSRGCVWLELARKTVSCSMGGVADGLNSPSLQRPEDPRARSHAAKYAGWRSFGCATGVLSAWPSVGMTELRCVSWALEISVPEITHGAKQVDGCGLIGDTVFAHRVDHHFIENIFGDKFVDERLFVLRVNVVVIRAKDNHEMTREITGVFDERSTFIRFGVLRRKPNQRFSPL